MSYPLREIANELTTIQHHHLPSDLANLKCTGVTNKEICEALGISTRHWENISTGKGVASKKLLKRSREVHFQWTLTLSLMPKKIVTDLRFISQHLPEDISVISTLVNVIDDNIKKATDKDEVIQLYFLKAINIGRIADIHTDNKKKVSDFTNAISALQEMIDLEPALGWKTLSEICLTGYKYYLEKYQSPNAVVSESSCCRFHYEYISQYKKSICYRETLLHNALKMASLAHSIQLCRSVIDLYLESKSESMKLPNLLAYDTDLCFAKINFTEIRNFSLQPSK